MSTGTTTFSARFYRVLSRSRGDHTGLISDRLQRLVHLPTELSEGIMSGSSRNRLETAAIVVGYTMSRLDDQYLKSQGLRTWKTAFDRAAKVLRVRPASLKNLRDEFDPFHDNHRKGWRYRPLRPNRQRVMCDLSHVSDDALLESVNRILDRDKKATKELLDSLMKVEPAIYNVAERLLTGRRVRISSYATANHGLEYRNLKFLTAGIRRSVLISLSKDYRSERLKSKV